eukprot:TRINITY_DN31991_c0_g1_i1.p1 TRINITY_DN31991_c0_g1~~TRINITY_DN31991_c0_g1_i1.p1  ORF type:complete len:471 (-),score=72.79 TRINITY_DN31991_c0_g1_i1:410-1822(-)
MVISYDAGRLQTGAICQISGSVLPKSFLIAFFPTVAAIVAGYLIEYYGIDYTPVANNATYSSFTFVVGFLLVFRNQTAYARFWEGTSQIQVLRGCWVNAFSTLLAFSNTSKKDKEEIAKFQMKLLRMFSTLHACSIDFIYGQGNGMSKILGIDEFENGALEFMNQVDNESMVFVVAQWIQQLILGGMADGTIPTPPPIVSRVFQDITGGVVMTENARKITDTPFPFPYCQVLQVVLLIHAFFTPAVFVSWCPHPLTAGALTFVAVTLFWSLNFISAEIEHPFGFDPNDIRIEVLQQKFNTCLMTMMHPMASQSPLKAECAINHAMEVPKLQEHMSNYSEEWAGRSSIFARRMNEGVYDVNVHQLYERCGRETAALEAKMSMKQNINNGTNEIVDESKKDAGGIMIDVGKGGGVAGGDGGKENAEAEGENDQMNESLLDSPVPESPGEMDGTASAAKSKKGIKKSKGANKE